MDQFKNEVSNNTLSSVEVLEDHILYQPLVEEIITKKHSRLGIASFVLGLISLFVIVTFFITANSVSNSESSVLEIILFYVIGAVIAYVASGILSFVGLILGIVGLFMKQVKKVYAIIGLTINLILQVIFILAALSGEVLKSLG